MAHAVTSFVDGHGVLAVLVLITLESCGVPRPNRPQGWPCGGSRPVALPGPHHRRRRRQRPLNGGASGGALSLRVIPVFRGEAV